MDMYARTVNQIITCRTNDDGDGSTTYGIRSNLSISDLQNKELLITRIVWNLDQIINGKC